MQITVRAIGLNHRTAPRRAEPVNPMLRFRCVCGNALADAACSRPTGMGAVQARRLEPGREALRQFDFWLGEWDLSWGDDGRATNSVYLDFDGRVIVESFDGRPSLELQGMSISCFDEGEDCWRQTWVDNNGNYLAFRGA